MQRFARAGTACLLAWGVMACGAEPPGNGDDETRAIMREIYGSIRVALPASADVVHFGDPEVRERVAPALQRLSDNAALLAGHMQQEEGQMQFLAGSVSRDAAEVSRAYAEGKSARAAFLLRQITENCVLCHTRLPSDDSPVAAGFVDDGALEELPPEPTATLQMATRQFDQALDTLEGLLLDPLEPAAVMIGPLTDYLVVSIRVKRDLERPAALLPRFAERRDLWPQLRSDVQAWIAALPQVGPRVEGKPSLQVAQALFDEGVALGDPASGERAGLVHLVAASAVAQRFVRTHPAPAELGQAYYLLGVIEARIGRNYWVTSAPYLLENAIRLAPDQPFADDAFDLLQRELLAAYEGADEEILPPEESARLEELRRLVNAPPLTSGTGSPR